MHSVKSPVFHAVKEIIGKRCAMRCKYCGGNVIGESCLQCSRRAVAIVPYKIRSFDDYDEAEKMRTKRRKSGREGICRCCGRKLLLWTDNLCSACVSHVNGRRGRYYPVNSPGREAVIMRLKERRAERKRRAGC